MAYDYKTNPPTWCKDAVPSDRGWRHPVTGELLVAVKGGCVLKKELLVEVPADVPVLAEDKSVEVIDEVVETVEIIDEEPAKEEVLAEEVPSKKKNKKK